MHATRSLHFDSPRIATVYQGVPQEQVQELLQFRAEYPYKHTTINGAPWDCTPALLAGEGEQYVQMAVMSATTERRTGHHVFADIGLALGLPAGNCGRQAQPAACEAPSPPRRRHPSRGSGR